jgi:LPXTG-motif cell wall-anchored protein
MQQRLTKAKKEGTTLPVGSDVIDPWGVKARMEAGGEVYVQSAEVESASGKATASTTDRSRSLFALLGLVVLIGLCWVLFRSRKKE